MGLGKFGKGLLKVGTLGVAGTLLDSPEAPQSPDYMAAAKEQGRQNIEAARTTAKLGNANIINPFGTQTTSWDGDQATVTQTLSPEQQAIYERQTGIQKRIGDIGLIGAENLQGTLSKPLSFEGTPGAPGSAEATREKVINAMMSRVDEDTARAKDQAQSNLIASGIRPGSKAYDDAMAMIDRSYVDARQQAISAAGAEAQRDFTMDTQRRKDAIAELLAQRQVPLEELMALSSGTQVASPFAGGLGYQGGATVAPAPTFAATQAGEQSALGRYGYDVANRNAMLQGLFSLGGAAIGASDRRLKKNIKPIGIHGTGITRYEWDYIGGEHAIGVMADELEAIMPSAVVVNDLGFKMVNYDMIGGR